MKRALAVVVLVAALAIGVDVLADLTQDRPDRVLPGTRSEIVLDLKSRDRGGSALLSAQGLWGACQGTVRHRLAEPGVVELSEGRFRLVTEPALGEHSWRRLQGCLEDTTLDKVKAHVVTKRDIGPAASP
ncbi:MAG TPA: hypothetical protein VM388_13140 [Acidimicrobiales bacterium]|nr:hypothetical protein [Acidimicrobiales bacterium]HWI02519.1 hypothetical protein [Acidimicrobiales bacterium]